jgi:hypothetical protein
MTRLLYFFYYLKQTDFKKFSKFLTFSGKKSGRSKIWLLLDSVYCCFRYNISLLDFFYFRFYKLEKKGRNKWAGTGFMYEYQVVMNPKNSRHQLENKIDFLNYFRRFIRRNFADIISFKSNISLANDLLNNKSGKLVLKKSTGQAGTDIEVVNCLGLTIDSLFDAMRKENYDLVEEYVIQHPALMKLSPSGLNTVRIITQLAGCKVDFLGARLRISVNSPVDNMAAGNIAAPVDMDTGIVDGPGVYSDITKNDESIHPVTGIKIEGFQIPFWRETKEMVKHAALFSQENKSVGWDVAITAEGPELIEGNHNWCKMLWQLPVKQGLKHILENYLKNN